MAPGVVRGRMPPASQSHGFPAVALGGGNPGRAWGMPETPLQRRQRWSGAPPHKLCYTARGSWVRHLGSKCQGVDGVKTKAPMPPRLNEVPLHPILTTPGDIQEADKTKPKSARGQRHNVGGVREIVQIGRDDMNLGDMLVTNCAQRGDGVCHARTHPCGVTNCRHASFQGIFRECCRQRT